MASLVDIRNINQQIKRPIVVSVINMKGGVGKSTITAMLARHAALRENLKVLVVDLDPQANLSQAFMLERYNQFLDDKRPSIVDVFRGHVWSTWSGSPQSVTKSHVLVENTDLGGPNVQLIPSQFNFADDLVNSTRTDTHALAKFLARRSFADRDLILIDCAPTESALTMAAYSSSRHVLVPVRPDYFATIGFTLLRGSLREFKNSNPGHPIDILGVVINNSAYSSGNDGGPEKSRSMDHILRNSEEFGWRVFKEQIPLSRWFPRMMRGERPSEADSNFAPFAEEFLDILGF